MVDCVFKAILGSEKHKNLLIHFLNAVLVPYGYEKITGVTIKNPYNDKEYETDKLTIVDIKAKDSNDNYYQIEVHLSIEPGLSKHMLFNWSDIYQKQLNEGDDFENLKPVISIWLLGENLFDVPKKSKETKEPPPHHHRFFAYDPVNQVTLCKDFNIHVLEVKKWKKGEKIRNEEERWLYFFKEGKNLDVDKPPKELLTSEMEEAMSVLKEFSEKEKEYDMYRNRMRALSMVKSYENKIDRLEKQLKEEKHTREKKEHAWEEEKHAWEEEKQELLRRLKENEGK